MYARTFEISACHFNGTATYDRYQEALAGGPSAAKLLRAVLADCHGHNFVIDVTVRGHAVQRTGELHAYLVSDAELEQVVREWDRTNLSVHPDFVSRRARATTEMMAAILAEKLATHFGARLEWEVRVHETRDIAATARRSA